MLSHTGAFRYGCLGSLRRLLVRGGYPKPSLITWKNDLDITDVSRSQAMLVSMEQDDGDPYKLDDGDLYEVNQYMSL